MKEINVKVGTSVTKYEATDGTVFGRKDDCEKYEQTALCVIKMRLRDMSLAVGNECSIFGVGDEENEVLVVVPRSSDDIDKIRAVLCACDSEASAECLTDKLIGKVVCIRIGYGEEWAEFRTLEEIVACATGGKYKSVKVTE